MMRSPELIVADIKSYQRDLGLSILQAFVASLRDEEWKWVWELVQREAAP
jgi:hypothetical protein